MNNIVGLIIVLILGYIAVCGFAYFAQEKLVYSPSLVVGQTPAAKGLVFEDVYLDLPSGDKIHAWDIPAKDKSKYVLFLHGNGGNIGNRLNTVSILNRLGLSVLIIDYRGYGNSGGRPSERGTYNDALAAFTYLTTSHGLDQKDIVVYGRSLGGAVAVWLASYTEPGGLIIESTFSRMVDMGKHRYPFLPVQLLTRIHYDSLSRIKEVKCRVFSAHSPDDKTVPFELGKALAEAAPNLIRFVKLKGSHNEAFFDAGEDYYELLSSFVRDSE